MVDETQIIFVDDELNIIRGLKRSLYSLKNNWNMIFCQSGQEALEVMAKQPIDIIVSDMRMPGMDGAELLDTVRKLYPDTIRVVLSGYADKDCVFRTVGPAHVYLAKPCDVKTVQETLSRPLALRKVLFGNDLRQILGGMTHLPSVPEIFSQLQTELTSQRVSAASVAKIIARDIAMTAELLKLTNSSYFAIGTSLTNPLEVVNLLGLEIVQSLILTIGIFRHFQGTPALADAIQALSVYSQRLGSLAEAMATAAGASPMEAKAAHCAAMLSPIGSLILLDNRAEEYQALLSTVGPDKPLHRAERERFGVCHHMIGAYLLSLWGFSDMVVEAVAFACEPSACTHPNNHLLTIVHAAVALGPPFPLLPPGISEPRLLDMKYLVEARLDKHLVRWQHLAATLEKA